MNIPPSSKVLSTFFHCLLCSVIFLRALLGLWKEPFSCCFLRAAVCGIRGGIKSNEWLCDIKVKDRSLWLQTVTADTRLCHNQCLWTLWSAHSCPERSRRYMTPCRLFLFIWMFSSSCLCHHVLAVAVVLTGYDMTCDV